MVPLTVTVTDTKGRYVTGLTGNDFEVFEDGVQQDVAFFASDGVPLDVALLVDTSRSMEGDLPMVRAAATGLAGKLRPTDRATVVDIKASASIVQELTERPERHRPRHSRPVGWRRDSGLRRRLRDAAGAGARASDRNAGPAPGARAADRRHRYQEPTAFEDVLDVARRSNVSIYVVALKSALGQTPRSQLPGEMLRSDYALKSVTRESGGRLYEPKTAVDLPNIYSAIAEELFCQYDLGYMPLRAVGGGDFRRVMVRLRPQTKALARTRTGYIASSTRAATAR